MASNHVKKSKIIILSLVLLVFCTSLKLSAQRVNFSGSWIINNEKSVFGEAPAKVVPKAIKVDQKLNKISIVRTMLYKGQEDKMYTEEFSLDGSEGQTISSSGNNERGNFRWAENKSDFILSLRYSTVDSQSLAVITEHWSLADSSKTLILQRSVEQLVNKLNYTMKILYDRKKDTN